MVYWKKFKTSMQHDFFMLKVCIRLLKAYLDPENHLRTFGINVHAHPFCACVFLTDSKTISAIVSGPTVHFYKKNFLRMVLVPWYSTIEIKKGIFIKTNAYLLWKRRIFYAMSAIQRGK